MQNSVRAIYFPYCLQQRKDKRWVILNRNYRPIGVLGNDWNDCEDLPADMCIKNITPTQAAKLSFKGECNASFRIYLYNDECVPTFSKKDMDAYLARIAVLMKLKNGGAKL